MRLPPPFSLVAVLTAMLCLIPSADAWEPDSTHPGLAETSALSSALHARLVEIFGEQGGLYTELVVPPNDAKELHARLRLYSPSRGFVPSAKGAQSALAWLSAGSVVADTPSSQATQHFLDPKTQKGLDESLGQGNAEALQRIAHSGFTRSGISSNNQDALSWVLSDKNPMGISAFWGQYKQSVTSRTHLERQRHLAGALIAAGAIHHVLVDLASPSHVRNDLAAHLQPLSQDESDVGSAFERLAAIAFGRLGVPSSATIDSPKSLSALFKGPVSLSELISKNYFSASTMPRSFQVALSATQDQGMAGLQKALVRDVPAPVALDLLSARSVKGATWRNNKGTCLARYRYNLGRVSFRMDDACALEQIQEILPVAGAYGKALIEHLFRGRLKISSEGIVATGIPLAKGSYTVMWDDALGNRSVLSTIKSDKGAIPDIAPPPAAAKKLILFFEGVDKNGESIMATGQAAWPLTE